MRQEMRSQSHRMVRQPIIDVEQETMHSVFDDRPHEISEEEAHEGLGEGG